MVESGVMSVAAPHGRGNKTDPVPGSAPANPAEGRVKLPTQDVAPAAVGIEAPPVAAAPAAVLPPPPAPPPTFWGSLRGSLRDAFQASPVGAPVLLGITLLGLAVISLPLLLALSGAAFGIAVGGWLIRRALYERRLAQPLARGRLRQGEIRSMLRSQFRVPAAGGRAVRRKSGLGGLGALFRALLLRMRHGPVTGRHSISMGRLIDDELRPRSRPLDTPGTFAGIAGVLIVGVGGFLGLASGTALTGLIPIGLCGVAVLALLVQSLLPKR